MVQVESHALASIADYQGLTLTEAEGKALIIPKKKTRQCSPFEVQLVMSDHLALPLQLQQADLAAQVGRVCTALSESWRRSSDDKPLQDLLAVYTSNVRCTIVRRKLCLVCTAWYLR